MTGPTVTMSDETLMCDCARCGAELLGDTYQEWHASLAPAERSLWPGVVCLRVEGRPYCRACVERMDEFERRRL